MMTINEASWLHHLMHQERITYLAAVGIAQGFRRGDSVTAHKAHEQARKDLQDYTNSLTEKPKSQEPPQ